MLCSHLAFRKATPVNKALWVRKGQLEQLGQPARRGRKDRPVRLDHKEFKGKRVRPARKAQPALLALLVKPARKDLLDYKARRENRARRSCFLKSMILMRT